MTSEDTFTDIANAVMRLRHAFLRHGLTPPVSIELAEHVDGDRLLRSLPRDLVMARPVMDKDHPEWCFEFQGLEFRYPAKWRYVGKGGREVV